MYAHLLTKSNSGRTYILNNCSAQSMMACTHYSQRNTCVNQKIDGFLFKCSLNK